MLLAYCIAIWVTPCATTWHAPHSDDLMLSGSRLMARLEKVRRFRHRDGSKKRKFHLHVVMSWCIMIHHDSNVYSFFSSYLSILDAYYSTNTIHSSQLEPWMEAIGCTHLPKSSRSEASLWKHHRITSWLVVTGTCLIVPIYGESDINPYKSQVTHSFQRIETTNQLDLSRPQLKDATRGWSQDLSLEGSSAWNLVNHSMIVACASIIHIES